MQRFRLQKCSHDDTSTSQKQNIRTCYFAPLTMARLFRLPSSHRRRRRRGGRRQRPEKSFWTTTTIKTRTSICLHASSSSSNNNEEKEEEEEEEEEEEDIFEVIRENLPFFIGGMVAGTFGLSITDDSSPLKGWVEDRKE